jgi:kinesin family member 26
MNWILNSTTFHFSVSGKTHSMLGNAEQQGQLGVVPCAISWLFRGINEQKQKTGARFSVRVSAVEVAGQSQHLRDLLAGHANGKTRKISYFLPVSISMILKYLLQ